MSELRLHVGDEQAKAGWILDVQAGPGVDFVGTCTDPSGFDDASVAENRVSLNVIASRN